MDREDNLKCHESAGTSDTDVGTSDQASLVMSSSIGSQSVNTNLDTSPKEPSCVVGQQQNKDSGDYNEASETEEMENIESTAGFSSVSKTEEKEDREQQTGEQDVDREQTGEDSSTDSLSHRTVEAAGSSLPDHGSSDQSPVHTASVLSSSCYATSDSDSSSCMYRPQSSSDYEGSFLTQHFPTVANGSILRPDSLSLPRSLQYLERQRLANQDSESSVSEHSRSSSTDALIEAASSTPLHVQGTVTKEGDMLAFVAEGLTEMIKMSSPLTKKELDADLAEEATSLDVYQTVTPEAGQLSLLQDRSASLLTQSPEDIPPIDPRVIFELEQQARRVADSLDHMMGTLQNNLHKMSAIAVNCLDAYKEGVDHSCDSVDAAIKSMYALMAKCEELSKTVRPIYALQEQLKEIKRLLGLFEVLVTKEEK